MKFTSILLKEFLIKKKYILPNQSAFIGGMLGHWRDDECVFRKRSPECNSAPQFLFRRENGKDIEGLN